MKYGIYYTPQPDTQVGLEIVPPLGALAAEGLAKALSQVVTAVGHIPVTEAFVTRNDNEGTALIVRFDEALEDPIDAALLARRLMDPTSRHQINT